MTDGLRGRDKQQDDAPPKIDEKARKAYEDAARQQPQSPGEPAGGE